MISFNLSAYHRFSRYTAIVVLTTAIVFLAGCSGHSDVEPVRQVSVSATGTYQGTPDQASVTGSVETVKDEPRLALEGAQQKLDALVKAIDGLGVPAEDYQAAQITVNPVWEYPRNQSRHLSGYRAVARFSVVLKDLTLLPKLYSTLAAGQITDLSAAQFSFSNKQELEEKAIENAVELARDKAAAALRPLRQSPGEAISVAVDTQWRGQPFFKAERMSLASDASAPAVNVGEHTVTSSVNVVFKIR